MTRFPDSAHLSRNRLIFLTLFRSPARTRRERSRSGFAMRRTRLWQTAPARHNEVNRKPTTGEIQLLHLNKSANLDSLNADANLSKFSRLGSRIEDCNSWRADLQTELDNNIRWICPNTKLYLSIYQIVFVQKRNCICPNTKRYLSKLQTLLIFFEKDVFSKKKQFSKCCAFVQGEF